MRYNRAVSLYDLDPGPESPEIVRMIVEIPKGSSNKYEYDCELELFRLSRAFEALTAGADWRAMEPAQIGLTTDRSQPAPAERARALSEAAVH